MTAEVSINLSQLQELVAEVQKTNKPLTVRLADGVGVEAVGGKDFGAGVGEALADRAYNIWPSDVEQVVVAALIPRKVERASIIGAAEPFALDRGAIGAVLDEDPLCGFDAKVLRYSHCLALTPSRWQIA